MSEAAAAQSADRASVTHMYSGEDPFSSLRLRFFEIIWLRRRVTATV